jgi:hypothetical protein
MSQMPDIDGLLSADEINVRQMQKLFENYQGLPELLNMASVLYSTCCRVFGQTLSQEMRGLPHDTAVKQKVLAKLQRSLLLARIGVLYTMSVTDLLRMRLTGPLGYVRLQCESFALIKLMFEEPSIAQEWMAIETDKDGKAFFNKYQKRVKTILSAYNLSDTYDQTSGTASHSRFIGLARGFKHEHLNDGHRVTDRHIILAQEFNSNKPDSFMLYVFKVLQVQAQIFAFLSDAVPEINDPLLLETRIPQFVAQEEHLFGRFREHFAQRYPNVANRIN